MKINEKSTIYWTLDDIKDNFNIESNEKAMITISTDIMLMMTNLWMLKKWLMTFISNIQEKRTKKQHSCKHEYSRKKSNVTILVFVYSSFSFCLILF